MSSPRASAGGFTILEVLVAMAVLMIGLSAALALLASGSATGKRAVDETSAALVASRVLADLEGRLTAQTLASLGDSRPAVLVELEGGEGTHWVPMEEDAPPVPPPDEVPGEPAGGDSRPRRSRWQVVEDGEVRGYPSYRYDLALVAMDDEGLRFLAEVLVRWTKGGQGRVRGFQTVVVLSPPSPPGVGP
ncbi:MAG: prepilin-type N-terminal cleavage/methylation domain-containing protein [Planctomycetes bacterium]|nr:prepilin-type N-terminal cleavage/methylation domain-containing protein [Planctomycetota bacterium]